MVWDAAKKKRVAITVGVVVVGALMLTVGIVLLYWVEQNGMLFEFLEWLQDIGYWGNLIIALIYIPSNFPFVIGYALLTLASGALFGFWKGLLTVIIGSQLGMLAVYTVVNLFFKKRTENWIQNSGGKYANAIMKEVETHKIKFSFSLRLLPLPIGLQNCMLAVSSIPLWLYQVTSGFGLLFKQAPEVYLGSTLANVAEIISGSEGFSVASAIPIVLGIAAVFIFVILLVFLSRNVLARLKQMEDEELDAVVEEVEANVVDVELEEIEAPEESSVFSVADEPSAIASSEVFSVPQKQKKPKPTKLPVIHISANDVTTDISENDDNDIVEIELQDFGKKLPGKRKKWKYSKFEGAADDPEEIGEIAPTQTPDDLEMEAISPV